MANELFLRLIEGLDAAKVPVGRGRVKNVAEKTGYSAGMVSRILTGKVDPAGKFLIAVCTAFNIRGEWIVDGIEPILVPSDKDEKAELSIAVQKRLNEKLDYIFGTRPVIDAEKQFTEEDIERIDREVFDLISPERREKERFIAGLVRRLPDNELQPAENYLLDLVKKNK